LFVTLASGYMPAFAPNLGIVADALGASPSRVFFPLYFMVLNVSEFMREF